MALTDNFVANIKEACEERKLSQREIARRTGLSYVHINRILAGTHSPTLDTCEKIALAIGIRADIAFLEPTKTRG